MSHATSSSGTAYADLDWVHYMRYRPAYPPSLREIIYRYHTRRSPDDSTAPGSSTHWDLLLDVGGGIGVSSMPFLGDFSTVHLLDPSPLNHEKAKVFLGEHVTIQKWPTKLEFTVGKAEEYADERAVAAESGASLAICATAAHFIDPSMLIRAMYNMIRPGGTMAIYSYWIPIFPDLNPGLGDIFGKTVTKAMKLCIRDEKTRLLFVDAGSRLCAGTAVLDAIAVPRNLFEDVQRIQINPQTLVAMDSYREDPPAPYMTLPSQVGQHEDMITYVEGTDAEADGWSKIVDLDFLQGMVRTILPADIKLSEEQHEALYGDLARAFAAECPSGSARVTWGLNMILATKRSSAVTEA